MWLIGFGFVITDNVGQKLATKQDFPIWHPPGDYTGVIIGYLLYSSFYHLEMKYYKEFIASYICVCDLYSMFNSDYKS